LKDDDEKTDSSFEPFKVQQKVYPVQGTQTSTLSKIQESEISNKNEEPICKIKQSDNIENK